MWERLTPADIERAKQLLVDDRNATLARHAAELEALAAEERQIDDFARLARVFAEKYVSAGTKPAQTVAPPTGETPPQSPAAVEESEPPAGSVGQEMPPPQIEIHQQISPNFGGPFRRLVGR